MNITLIGMPLAGKSAIGRALAKRLNYRFVDIDAIIEADAKLALQDIIDDLGECRFLEFEEDAVLKLSDLDNTVVAPGGSVIYSQKAMARLQSISTIVWLDAPLQLIKQRLSAHPRRGVIGLSSLDIRALYRDRQPLYEKYAVLTIKVGTQDSIEQIVACLIQSLRKDTL